MMTTITAGFDSAAAAMPTLMSVPPPPVRLIWRALNTCSAAATSASVE